jgi:CRP/FNR family transcriptional regulator, anaerobic regulatory protein
MPNDAPIARPDFARIKVACTNCTLYQLCLPVGMGDPELALLEDIIKVRRPLARGQHLYQMGDGFASLYAVRSGSLKTYTLTEDGREQVTGFHLPGELVGLDAISAERHHCAAKALETTSVCEIPFDRFEELWVRIPSLPHQLLRLMSKEMRHDQTLLMLLGKKAAEERLAAFLVNLAGRFGQRGFSSREFNLSMSRNDIGNYLGLAVETVSRLFTHFQELSLLNVHRKSVQLLDLPALQALAGVSEPPPDCQTGHGRA